VLPHGPLRFVKRTDAEDACLISMPKRATTRPTQRFEVGHAEYLFSAKGASSIESLGHRPRVPIQIVNSAESAIQHADFISTSR
jgi:hypothetical protein